MGDKTNRILFTGGGSAGHVTPNLALIKKFSSSGWEVFYIGSYHGIEKALITRLDIPYFAICSGKLRRYFSWRNFIDPFKILFAIVQAFFICFKIKPNVVFSKGGFVSFPVTVAAWLNRIPVVIHESDLTPGLANKLSFFFAREICVSFPETAKYFQHNKAKSTVTGSPIREDIFYGDARRGREFCGFADNKKIILIQGGGLGASDINIIIRKLLPQLLNNFYVVHICGKGKVDKLLQLNGYVQYEYLHEDFADIIAAADIVISRAGANSIYELLALRKPHILIPLAKSSSRGDQIVNANYFAKRQLSRVIAAEDLSAEKLLSEIHWMLQNLALMQQRLAEHKMEDSTKLIYDILGQYGESGRK